MSVLLFLVLSMSSTNVCEVDGEVLSMPNGELQSGSILFDRYPDRHYSVYWVNRSKTKSTTKMVCIPPEGDIQWDFLSRDKITGAYIPEEVVKSGGACLFLGKGYSFDIDYYVCECRCQKKCRCQYLEDLLYGGKSEQ